MANEVKELAKQTAVATEEIGRQIQDMQTNTTGAVEMIERIAKIIGEINRIKMVKPDFTQMEKGDDGLMRLSSGKQAPADAEVHLTTGTLEGSNVNIVSAMVDMIELSRRYEMQVKMMKTAGDIEEASASIMRLG